MTKEEKKIIDKIASRIREIYNLGFPAEVDKLAGMLGIDIVYAKTYANGRYYEKDGKFFIEISTRIKDNEEEKRFAIAHKIGHGILHGNLLNEASPDTVFCYSSDENREIDLEYEADEFALELLIPTEKLKSDLKSRKPGELSDVYGVSKDLIEYKAGIISAI